MNALIDEMVECTLAEPDDFLKIRETLTRIGVASRKDKTLFQSCHILHNKDDIILSILKNYLHWMANLLTIQRMIKREETQ